MYNQTRESRAAEEARNEAMTNYPIAHYLEHTARAHCDNEVFMQILRGLYKGTAIERALCCVKMYAAGVIFFLLRFVDDERSLLARDVF